MTQSLEIAACERKCFARSTTAKEQRIRSDIGVLTELS